MNKLKQYILRKIVLGFINGLLKDREQGAEKVFLKLTGIISRINTVLELLTKVAVRLKDGLLTEEEAQTTMSDVKQTLTIMFKDDK